MYTQLCREPVYLNQSLHSKQKYAYNTHNTTHLQLYIGNIFANVAHTTATYKIIDHQIGVIVAVIRDGYGLPEKCARYMGLVWADRRNNTHNSAIMGCFLQSGSFKVVSVFLFIVYQYDTPLRNTIGYADVFLYNMLQ